jgi:hypothetical protein
MISELLSARLCSSVANTSFSFVFFVVSEPATSLTTKAREEHWRTASLDAALLIIYNSRSSLAKGSSRMLGKAV